MRERNETAGNAEPPRPAFQPRVGALGALVAAALALILGMDWPDGLIGMGIGFLLGGASPLAAGIWQYLGVFAALVGGFVWFLVHYVR